MDASPPPSPPRPSHFRPRTRDGWIATVAFLALFALYVTLVLVPHPLGMHGAVWSLLANAAVALNVSAVTRPPSAATIQRIHAEVERFVYGEAAR